MPGLVAIKAICYLGLKDIAMNTKVLLINANQQVESSAYPGSSAKVDFTCLQCNRRSDSATFAVWSDIELCFS